MRLTKIISDEKGISNIMKIGTEFYNIEIHGINKGYNNRRTVLKFLMEQNTSYPILKELIKGTNERIKRKLIRESFESLQASGYILDWQFIKEGRSISIITYKLEPSKMEKIKKDLFGNRAKPTITHKGTNRTAHTIIGNLTKYMKDNFVAKDLVKDENKFIYAKYIEFCKHMNKEGDPSIFKVQLTKERTKSPRQMDFAALLERMYFHAYQTIFENEQDLIYNIIPDGGWLYEREQRINIVSSLANYFNVEQAQQLLNIAINYEASSLLNSITKYNKKIKKGKSVSKTKTIGIGNRIKILQDIIKQDHLFGLSKMLDIQCEVAEGSLINIGVSQQGPKVACPAKLNTLKDIKNNIINNYNIFRIFHFRSLLQEDNKYPKYMELSFQAILGLFQLYQEILQTEKFQKSRTIQSSKITDNDPSRSNPFQTTIARLSKLLLGHPIELNQNGEVPELLQKLCDERSIDPWKKWLFSELKEHLFSIINQISDKLPQNRKLTLGRALYHVNIQDPENMYASSFLLYTQQSKIPKKRLKVVTGIYDELSEILVNPNHQYRAYFIRQLYLQQFQSESPPIVEAVKYAIAHKQYQRAPVVKNFHHVLEKFKKILMFQQMQSGERHLPSVDPVLRTSKQMHTYFKEDYICKTPAIYRTKGKPGTKGWKPFTPPISEFWFAGTIYRRTKVPGFSKLSQAEQFQAIWELHNIATTVIPDESRPKLIRIE